MKAQKKLIDLFTNKPSAEVDYAAHRAMIDKHGLEADRMIFVGHSQGNLFMNQAYDYAKKIMPAESIGVVHAAPASVKLNGTHTLADRDLLINGLRFSFPFTPSITHYIPTYQARPVGINGGRDWLGHGFAEIYLNNGLSVGQATFDAITTQFTALKPRPPLAKSGFATLVATWNGPGDVDLHIKEPNGTKVWAGSKIGDSGELDLNNSSGYGPEHYYVSCTPTKVQTGQYPFAFTNPKGNATGRTVTLSLYADGYGYLDSATFPVPAVTSNQPNAYAGALVISQKPVAQRSSIGPSIKDYEVSLVKYPQ